MVLKPLCMYIHSQQGRSKKTMKVSQLCYKVSVSTDLDMGCTPMGRGRGVK